MERGGKCAGVMVGVGWVNCFLVLIRMKNIETNGVMCVFWIRCFLYCMAEAINVVHCPHVSSSKL